MALGDSTLTGSATPLDAVLGIAKGTIKNHIPIFVIGGNTSVGTLAEAIWECGSHLPNVDISQTYTLTSTDPADSFSGTGAQVARVAGLDANHDPVVESITVGGKTSELHRINNFFVAVSGSNKGNVGTLSLVGDTDGLSYACMLPGRASNSGAVFTVPEGMRLLISEFNWFVGRKQTTEMDIDAVFEVEVEGLPFNTVQRVRIASTNSQGTSSASSTFPIPASFPERTTVWFEATSGTPTAEVGVFFSGILVDNLNRGLSPSDIMGTTRP